MRSAAAVLGFAIGWIGSTPASHAESLLTGAQLHESCLEYEQAPRSGGGLFCAAYVRGFLDGVSAIELRIRSDGNVALEAESGIRRGDDRPPYCIEGSITIDRLVAGLRAGCCSCSQR
jgi:hypothetical protein